MVTAVPGRLFFLTGFCGCSIVWGGGTINEYVPASFCGSRLTSPGQLIDRSDDHCKLFSQRSSGRTEYLVRDIRRSAKETREYRSLVAGDKEYPAVWLYERHIVLLQYLPDLIGVFRDQFVE